MRLVENSLPSRRSTSSSRSVSSPLSCPSLGLRERSLLLAIEKLGEYAGVRIVVQHAPRLGEHRPAPGSVATRGSYRASEQPDEGWPGAQAGQSSSRRKTALQPVLGFL